MGEEIAPEMSENEALRRILAALEALVATQAQTYSSINGDNEVPINDAGVDIRAADPDSLKAAITNTGDEKVKIYEGITEDDVTSYFLVAILYPDQTWESPLGGTGILRGQTYPGLETTVALAYQK